MLVSNIIHYFRPFRNAVGVSNSAAVVVCVQVDLVFSKEVMARRSYQGILHMPYLGPVLTVTSVMSR